MTRARRMRELQTLRKQRREVRRRTKDLTHLRDWIHSHPGKVDPEVRPAAIDFLNGSIAELDKLQKMKNTLPARRVRLRDRLRLLVVTILTQTPLPGK